MVITTRLAVLLDKLLKGITHDILLQSILLLNIVKKVGVAVGIEPTHRAPHAKKNNC